MKTTKALFFELMYDFQSERWNEFELPKLSLRELLALAKLLGCPSCGSKETVIVRLLAQRELRLQLARFTDNPAELAISYKRESLRDMCREAGIWRSGNKRALATGLLNWRDRCRARGQAFLAEMRSLAKDRPQQLSFSVLTEEPLTFYPRTAGESTPNLSSLSNPSPVRPLLRSSIAARSSGILWRWILVSSAWAITRDRSKIRRASPTERCDVVWCRP
jgi:hypothetical protein